MTSTSSGPRPDFSYTCWAARFVMSAPAMLMQLFSNLVMPTPTTKTLGMGAEVRQVMKKQSTLHVNCRRWRFGDADDLPALNEPGGPCVPVFSACLPATGQPPGWPAPAPCSGPWD